MHALQLPPRHFWRATLLALLLVVITMTAISGGLGAVDFTTSGPDESVAGSSAAVSADPGAGSPATLVRPLDPTFQLER